MCCYGYSLIVSVAQTRLLMINKACYFPKAGHILEFVYSICKKSLSLLFRILLYLVEACLVLMQEKSARYSTAIEPFSICELLDSLIDSILPNDQLTCKLSDFCCETHSLKDIM